MERHPARHAVRQPDFTRLNELRKKYAAAYEAKGVQAYAHPASAEGLVETLKKHPIFNSSLDEVANEIVFKEYYHLGIAVDTEQGLIVPVIRDVIATKFTFNPQEGNPNAGGNGRKNIYRALEGSLRRLKLDYVDLYWMHVWDTLTPVEEVVSTLTDLVRAGKIRYYGFSDVPAWYAAKAHTFAGRYGFEPPIALQLEYSLVERSIEREHIPAARELGMGVCPWSPLASGLLTGKYTKDGPASSRGSRLDVLKESNNPVFNKFTERNWRILDTLQEVSKQLGRSMAEVALNWAANQPGITSTIIGATSLKQLEANLSSITFEFPAEAHQKLDEVSKLEPSHPYMFFDGVLQERVRGGTNIRKWS